jgi:hypothetical protein
MSHNKPMALAALLALLLSGDVAYAGGPLIVRDTGAPFVWSTAAEVQYRTDNGPLSATVTEATARTRVNAMFQVWEDVTTANIGYNRAGFINAVGAFAGGDVNTVAEFDAVEADCGNGNQSPIVYDADGSIFIGLGLDETMVIGFAGPCAINATQIVSGEAAMNGLFQDGDGVGTPNVPDLVPSEYDGAFIHEFGHFSGLDHSQINLNCLTAGCADGADDTFGLPTMFPFVLSDNGGDADVTLEEAPDVAAVSTLATDDIAWISRLYPSGTFSTTHGTITGVVFFTDGQSHAQGVNVIARPVNDGGTPENESRRNAVSVVSGFKFTANPGQSVTSDYLPCTPPSACPPNGFGDDNSGGSGFGSLSAGDIGLFEIPVPAGSYTIEVESIHCASPTNCFDGGSSVGPFSTPIPMPGTAPAALGPVAVAAGATNSGNNPTLIGTDPRFDQFEGP